MSRDRKLSRRSIGALALLDLSFASSSVYVQQVTKLIVKVRTQDITFAPD
jgi:hypothetical protein